MKKIFILALFAIPFSIFCDDEEEIKSKLKYLYGANNMATDFWFAIPPAFVQHGGENFIKLYISSPTDANITVDISGISFSEARHITANTTTAITLTPNQAQPFLHSSDAASPASDVYAGRGIHLVSDAPVVVYVVVHFTYTSDSFLALPTPYLGTEYISATYDELGWNAPTPGAGQYPSWVLVTATDDDTDVNVVMGGGDSEDRLFFADTLLAPGESKTIENMDAGDVLVLSTKDFYDDQTGTRITSDKPVSVVSGHFCTNIPSGNSWCDYSADALIPVDTWGTTYIVPRVPGRKKSGIVRIFAALDSTGLVRDTDMNDTLRIDLGGGAVKGTGFIETRVSKHINDTASGAFISEMPISVVFYNPGVQEDQAIDSDPFFMQISPLKMFRKSAMILTPYSEGGLAFKNNYLIVVVASEDYQIPPSLQVADFSDSTSPIIFNHIDSLPRIYVDTVEVSGNIYLVICSELENGYNYYVACDESFAAYTVGGSPYNGYGHPAVMGFEKEEMPNLTAPEFGEETYDKNKVVFDVSSESKVSAVLLFPDASRNVTMLTSDNEDATGVELTIDDPEDYRAEIAAVDKHGNVSFKVLQSGGTSAEITQGDDHDMMISPNPTEGRFDLSFVIDKPAGVRISLIDMKGTMVRELASGALGPAGTNTHSFDLSSMSPGAYFIRLDIGGHSTLRKFSIVR